MNGTPTYALEFERPLRDLARQLDELRQQSIENNVDMVNEIRSIEKKIEAMQREIYSSLTPWQKVSSRATRSGPTRSITSRSSARAFKSSTGTVSSTTTARLSGAPLFLTGRLS